MSHGYSRRRLRYLVQVIAPGILALSGYRPSWLPSDLAAGLSVAAIALPVGIGAVAAIGLFAATAGHVLVTGAAWAPLAGLLPMLNGGFFPAFGVFLGALLAVLLVIYVFAALINGIGMARNGRKATVPAE